MIGLAALATTLVAYTLLADRLDRWSISAAMVFVVAGGLIGPSGLDLFHVQVGNEAIRTIAELTLGVLLFADASTVALRAVEGDLRVPARLLFVGLPLTIVAGALAARGLFPDAGWAGAALIASILAPTDAALGLGIFTDRSVPVRIRRALNVESGLNDGIATPFVTLFLAILVAEGATGPSNWLTAALIDIGVAVAVAVCVGVGGARLLRAADASGWTTPSSEEFSVLAFALMSYALAIALSGNGFVAAFLAGIIFGSQTGHAFTEPTAFTERVGLLASFVVWGIFGGLFAAPLLTGGIHLAPVVYALVSLTIVRMIPAAIALLGTKFDRATVAFMGWFGPRGLASVVFMLIAFEDLDARGSAGLLVEVATWTILLSVVLHGLSARPFAAAYGRHVAGRSEEAPERLEMTEPVVRRTV
jgi:NhaP-type Na+/H+ or K+/H+ antiporter